MSDPTIAFIGGGNMARSLIGGLIADGTPADQIRVADPDAGQRETLVERLGVMTTESNSEAITGADVVVLAVKPALIKTVAADLGDQLRAQSSLTISIAAGVREADISRWLGGDVAVVRCMPNTPALVQCGMTALYANEHVSPGQRGLTETLLQAVGAIEWIPDEAIMDSVTAVSGSGPAYFFLVMEAIEAAGAELGLDRATARRLTLQTALGAARMAAESDEDPATLRQRVTSPGGTTEAATKALEAGDIHAVFQRALAQAVERAGELGDQLGNQ
jgi:pyrroline-5-carboxylate reductase